MSSRALALSLGALAAAAAALAAEPSSVRLEVAGELLAVAPAPGPGAPLLLLARTADGPRLHVFESTDPPRLLLDMLALPEGVEDVATADVDGDGVADPVALGSGGWWWIRGSIDGPELVELPRHDGRWAGPPRQGLVAPVSAAPLASAAPGRFRVGDVGPVRRLPITAERTSRGLELSSPRMLPLAGGWVGWGDGDGQRVPAVWIPGAGEAVELDLVLPEPERVTAVSPVLLDGEAHLLVESMVGMGLVSNKRLRLYPLPAVAGALAPILAEELDVNAWQEVEPFGRDVDGDGLEDLVVLAPPGMRGGRLGIWTFRRREGGGFVPPVGLRRPLGGHSFVGGRDLDGDGRPDLLLVAGRTVSLFPGVAGPEHYTEVAALHGTVDLAGPEPEVQDEVTVSVGGGPPVERRRSVGHAVVDLDGDDVAEVVLWRRGEDASSVVILGFAAPR